MRSIRMFGIQNYYCIDNSALYKIPKKQHEKNYYEKNRFKFIFNSKYDVLYFSKISEHCNDAISRSCVRIETIVLKIIFAQIL